MRRRALLLGTGAALGALTVVGSVAVLTPPVGLLGHVNALVVLAGDEKTRLPLAQQLLAERVAPVLLVSLTPDDTHSPRTKRLCQEHRDDVLCFAPSPPRTRGEARAVASIAREKGWSSVAVVTSDYHVRRARLLFRRCFSGSLVFVGAGSRASWWQDMGHVAHEVFGLAEAELRRSC